jgi:Protein of unknown function (DUF3485)
MQTRARCPRAKVYSTMNNAFVITDEAQKNTPVPLKRGFLFEWRWVFIIGILLGASGGIRNWRDWRFHSLSKESAISPFSLSEIPNTLGDWHVVEGSESTLEPDIARITGATDHIIRMYNYVGKTSGETAVVMILYGLARDVWPHTPDACYPANGFRSVSPSRGQDIDIGVPEKSTSVRFRVQHFVKAKPGQVDYRVVYYSFQNAGEWGLDKEQNWKSFRYHPGMFKVQIQCQASSSGKIDESSVQELIGRIVYEIEHRSAAKS